MEKEAERYIIIEWKRNEMQLASHKEALRGRLRQDIEPHYFLFPASFASSSSKARRMLKLRDSGFTLPRLPFRLPVPMSEKIIFPVATLASRPLRPSTPPTTLALARPLAATAAAACSATVDEYRGPGPDVIGPFRGD